MFAEEALLSLHLTNLPVNCIKIKRKKKSSMLNYVGYCPVPLFSFKSGGAIKVSGSLVCCVFSLIKLI